VVERLIFGAATGEPDRNHVAEYLDESARSPGDLKMGREWY
jgi:hypothetical protein